VALAEVILAEPTCRMATARNLIVYSWRDAASLSQIKASGRVARATARKHPKGAGSIHVIAGGIPRFTDEVRTEAALIRGDRSLSSLGIAEVVLVEGLAGVAARSFLGTLALLGRSPRPQKAFRDVPSAAAWLAPKLAAGGVPWTAVEIEAAVAEVCAGHGAP
jgi:hypothetical protein